MPQVKPFDGSINPLNHLKGYKVLMMLQDVSDALLDLTFPMSLKKAREPLLPHLSSSTPITPSSYLFFPLEFTIFYYYVHQKLGLKMPPKLR